MGTAWRSVRGGQDPLVCGRPGGRWDDGTLGVLYTSETREGALAAVGLRVAGYGRLSYLEREQEYPRSQETAEACAFLGADGLRVPSARDVTQGNLMVFCEQPTVVETRVVPTPWPGGLRRRVSQGAACDRVMCYGNGFETLRNLRRVQCESAWRQL